MNLKVTSFTHPFSFFCMIDEKDEFAAKKLTSATERSYSSFNKNEPPKMVHGQYVAVYWKNMWLRGIVNMESQFLIWLIDYGMNIRFNEKIMCVELAPEFKKIPSKVFEASLHGVIPAVTAISSGYDALESQVSTTWSQAATTYSQQLIDSATQVLFVPVALVDSHHNEILIGDLYLKIPGRNYINLSEELSNVPTFIKINPQLYVQNMPKIYVNRRRHRACSLKPNIPLDIPTITTTVDFEEYSALCAKAPKPYFEPEIVYQSDGSTVVGKKRRVYKLTTEEIEEYAHMSVDICGTEYNLLNLLLNKIADLNLVEKCVKYEGKGVGRGFSRSNCL